MIVQNNVLIMILGQDVLLCTPIMIASRLINYYVAWGNFEKNIQSQHETHNFVDFQLKLPINLSLSTYVGYN